MDPGMNPSSKPVFHSGRFEALKERAGIFDIFAAAVLKTQVPSVPTWSIRVALVYPGLFAG